MQHFLAWVPHHCTTKAFLSKVHLFFAFPPPKKLEIWDLILWKVKVFCQLISSIWFVFNTFHYKQVILTKTKHPKQVLKKFRKLASIKKASFFFSPMLCQFKLLSRVWTKKFYPPKSCFISFPFSLQNASTEFHGNTLWWHFHFFAKPWFLRLQVKIV